MIKYLLVFSVIFLFSRCAEIDSEPSEYYFNVKNNYFELLDSVFLGANFIGKIQKDSISKEITVTKGSYKFYCKTNSELIITSNIKIQGFNNKIKIVVIRNGKIVFE